MKKLYLLIITIFPLFVKAQYTVIECGPNITPAVNYIYLGSLTLDTFDAGNSQKLQIDIIGGGWLNNDKGTTTFYIANRGGLSVHQVTAGSSAFSAYFLKAFQNGSHTDFYLSVNSAATYYSLAIRSLLFGFGTATQQFAITTTTTLPPGTDITASLNVNPVLITDGSGNIAMGTQSMPAGYKLAVNGAAIATSVTVKLNANWPDYVFQKGYELRSLADLKSYLDQNQHLPEIPSAEQINKGGQNLGEMNRLLLQKVEELTLYLIELKEQVNHLQQQVDSAAKSN